MLHTWKIASATALAVLLQVPSPKRGDSQGKPPARKPEPQATARPLAERLAKEVRSEAEALCKRGARGLAKLQKDDGSFNLGGARNPAPIAVCALSTLALLATGEVPGRTPYGRNVERGIRYLIDNQDRTGGDETGYIGAQSDQFSKMHGHGYATLALAQVAGMLPSTESAIVTQKEARAGLEAAVRLIESCQEPTTGGWYYDPVPRRHEGSMTICMVQALRAAKDAGVVVDINVIRKAIRYVERSQKPDGTFRYMLGDERSSTALTAAAVMTLNASGEYGSPILRKGMSYLTDRSDIFRTTRRVTKLSQDRFPYYERLYVGEALFTASEQSAFARWYKSVVPQLAASIDPTTGCWNSPSYGQAYATAMSVLVLSLPLQYLPIHQR